MNSCCPTEDPYAIPLKLIKNQFQIVYFRFTNKVPSGTIPYIGQDSFFLVVEPIMSNGTIGTAVMYITDPLIEDTEGWVSFALQAEDKTNLSTVQKYQWHLLWAPASLHGQSQLALSGPVTVIDAPSLPTPTPYAQRLSHL